MSVVAGSPKKTSSGWARRPLGPPDRRFGLKLAARHCLSGCVLFALLDRRDPVSFFQAEDCIRADLVTGVQTCALPILSCPVLPPALRAQQRWQGRWEQAQVLPH